jgi:hypothetical protein
MAIYQEQEDGSLLCVKTDLTQADIEQQVNAARLLEGKPPSSCIQEVMLEFNTSAPTITS